MLGASLFLAAVGATAAGPTVDLRGRDIRLGDLAALAGFAPAAHPRLAARVIASVPPGRTQLSITQAALASLVRRNVPGLAGQLVPGAGVVTFRAPPQPIQTDLQLGACAAIAQPVAQGAAIKPADIVAVPCEATEAGAPLRFDRRASAIRASAPLPAGTRLGRVVLSAAPDVDKGDELTLVSAVGPVRVERQVVALQAGRSGGRVFVRDAEGQVVAAPLAVSTETAR